MKRMIAVSVALVVLVGFWGCSGSSKLASTGPGNIPEWFSTPPTDPNFLFATATGASQDMQLAIDKASTDARAEIGREIQTRIMGLQKKFDEEVGISDNPKLLQQFTQASKTVVSTSLSGSTILKKQIKKEGTNWRAYVLMQYPLGAAQEAFLKQIKKNNEMYTRFRASQTFKELDDEVKKYEEYKAKQNQY